MNKLTVLLPAYNEESNIEKLVATWLNYENDIKDIFNLKLEIVIINDGSKDSTREISERLQEEHNNFKLINHEVNKGLGEGLKTGIKYVLSNSSSNDYACIMDCDNTQDPRYILDMLNKAKVNKNDDGPDIVTASRYRNGSSVKGLSKVRLMTSWGARLFYTLIIPINNVRDYTCGYRLYSVKILKTAYDYFDDRIVEERGFTCMAELLYKLHSIGGICDEVPFELRYDFKEGDSKMKIIKTTLNSIKLAFRLRKISTNIER